jgi:outer membrane autotransporter protein
MGLGRPTSGAGVFASPALGLKSGRNAQSTFDMLFGADAAAPTEPTTQAGLSPLSFMGRTEGASSLSFSTSLSQMMRFQADAEQRKIDELASADGALGMTGLGMRPPRTYKPSRWDLWMEGRVVSFSDDRNSKDSDGHFGVLYLGADYVLNPSLLIGALVQYDSMHKRSASAAFDIKGSGWMAGPYATARLSKNVFLQARAAIGGSNNDVSPFLTYTDSFKTERWLVDATLAGRWQFGPWQFAPSASVSYIQDRSDGYTDSLGVLIPSITASLGQVKVGPGISYRTKLSDGTIIEPRAGLQVIWNFESSGDAVNFGGTLAGPEELRGKVELGLKARLQSGVSLDFATSYDGIGSGSYHAVGGRGTLNIPLN